MKQLLIAIDQAANTIVFIAGDGFGMADETISARLWRCHLQDLLGARWYRLVDAVLGENHCFKSWRSEVDRRQLPGYYVLEN